MAFRRARSKTQLQGKNTRRKVVWENIPYQEQEWLTTWDRISCANSKQVGMSTLYETQCPALLIHHWQRLHPKSLYSQAPAKFSSLSWKQKTYIVAGGGGKTWGKRPRLLDLNQLSMIIIHIHSLSYVINFGDIEAWCPTTTHHEIISWRWWESPLHEKGTWAMLLGELCLWSIPSARKPAWGWTAQKVTHRTIQHLCQVTSSVCSLPQHYLP